MSTCPLISSSNLSRSFLFRLRSNNFCSNFEWAPACCANAWFNNIRLQHQTIQTHQTHWEEKIKRKRQHWALWLCKKLIHHTYNTMRKIQWFFFSVDRYYCYPLSNTIQLKHEYNQTQAQPNTLPVSRVGFDQCVQLILALFALVVQRLNLWGQCKDFCFGVFRANTNGIVFLNQLRDFFLAFQ